MYRIASFVTVLLLLFSLPLLATHNRAGEITYVQIDELTIRATITTYTKTSSTAADRDSLLMEWGDGTEEWLVRANGNGTELPNDVKVNYYIGTHTYPGRGQFTMSMRDQNRVELIRNLNWPNSVNIAFYIETTFTFGDPTFSGVNNSAILLQPPLDYACVGQRYVHNPNAYDIDGDSIAYDWTIPKQARGEDVPEYFFPNEINPGANNQLTLDKQTGTIIWDAPQEPGEYNIAFLIKEYRNGVLINSIVRDMQIRVQDECENRPPFLEFQERFCIEAGDTLSTTIHADDPDVPGQLIRISATGGPLDLENSPAIFDFTNNFVNPPIDATFVWRTICDHIRREPYQMVFRVEDNFEQISGLTDLKVMQIEVVGPPPENLVVDETIQFNELRWDSPYSCENSENQFFRGFVVWRKEGDDNVIEDDCLTDLASQGYEIIAQQVMDITADQYFYRDQDIQDNIAYCYRVTGFFTRISNNGVLINQAHSRPSSFACTNIRRDVPFITKASVMSTSETVGEVDVRWIAPFIDDFDTTIYIPPYRFELVKNNQTINSVELNSYGSFPDEFVYRDMNINTLTRDHTYTVNLYSDNILVGTSESAATIFLSLDNVTDGIQLDWTNNVPWQNDSFQVYRLTNSEELELLTTTRMLSYLDSDVVLDSTYCYLITSHGQYSFIPVEDIVNNSQEACLRREFDFPPCDPNVVLEANCNFGESDIPVDSFAIVVNWSHTGCPQLLDDVIGYNIFFRENGADDFVQLNSVPVTGLSYTHKSEHGTSGCFFVRAVNSANLESPGDNETCFTGDESCTALFLPNAFTPNGDNVNDIYRPIAYRFVNSLEISIFNRWGNKVFETTDIEINWDGKDMNGNDVDPGTYFYVCKFGYNSDLSSGSTQEITGYIEVLRN